MTKPMITIHDVATDEVTVREMNATEIAQWEADKLQSEKDAGAKAQALAAKEAAWAKLAALGLTTDDLKALGL
jgi:hypothetical protein